MEGLHIILYLCIFVYLLKKNPPIKWTCAFKTVLFKGQLRLLVGEGNGTPLQYSCLENPMDGGAWKAAVHGVAEGRTGLSDFTFTFHFHALEKEMATHPSILAWKIPWIEEPGRLQSKESQRVGNDWATEHACKANISSILQWEEKQIWLLSKIH